MPLVITHGWPGSVVEFQKVIARHQSTAYGGDAADAFHVVCPSLPGFGFLGPTQVHRLGVERIAARGRADGPARYQRYGAQGGDWGSAVTASLGAQDPQHCAGIHITWPWEPGQGRRRSQPRERGRWAPSSTTETGIRALEGTVDPAADRRLWPQRLARAGWLPGSGEILGMDDCDGTPENILSRDELAGQRDHRGAGRQGRGMRPRCSIKDAGGTRCSSASSPWAPT